MNQTERRKYLIKRLLSEQPRYEDIAVPEDPNGQRRLLRSLMNVRMPAAIGEEFLQVQDEYLAEAAREKGVTDLSRLTPVEDHSGIQPAVQVCTAHGRADHHGRTHVRR